MGKFLKPVSCPSTVSSRRSASTPRQALLLREPNAAEQVERLVPAQPPRQRSPRGGHDGRIQSIEIDGDEIGITPLAGVFLAPGDHDFRVTMPDGTILERTVRIAPDNRHIAFSQ